jgi:hypothetical protein
MSLSKKKDWVEVIAPANEMNRMLGHTDEIRRRLDDMPERVPPGAKEAALLTIWVKEQEFAFKPIMESLAVLASLKDWSDSFLVADKLTPGFNWKQQPFRKYASFQDFYESELEKTWGTWDNLQKTYAQVAKGKISEKRGVRLVLRLAQNTVPAKQPWRPKKDESGTNKKIGTTYGRNSAAYLTSVIAREAENPNNPNQVQIAQVYPEMKAGKYKSVRAAAIDAGIIKPKKTALQRLQAIWNSKRVQVLWQKAKPDERKKFLDELYGGPNPLH